MNEGEIEQIRQKLLLLRSELEELEETSKEASKPIELDQARVGRLSRMDAMQAQQMAQEAARRQQHQRLMIEGALRRIESGKYGYCFVCGEEIDIRRLSVVPTNTRCIECIEK
ncbi:MAG: TraR/DksA family transcriptional regulator [Candidatus Parabeggiatoa sp. nov. 2]|nr:MAG: conjugal transfer protein TraR [Beggiatoa sp. 4572_84]RKZ60423.1 MAG: TraR/DksA family transcriptional regulator [Gammaproteobacteria bacterium]